MTDTKSPISRSFLALISVCSIISTMVLPIPGGIPARTSSIDAPVLSPAAQPASTDQVQQSMVRMPVCFEENQGQFNSKVRYFARGTSGYDLFLTATDAIYVLTGRETNLERQDFGIDRFNDPARGTERESTPTKAVAVYMTLAGANPDAVSSGTQQLEHRTNYFKGEESNWRTNIPNYGQVRMSDVYEGIDTVWHGLEGGGVQYDFVVEPFADTNQIKWEVEGAKSVELDSDGNLLIKTDYGEIEQNKPFTYQETDGFRQEVESRFVVEGTEVRFYVGDYNRSKELTIDPAVNLGDLAFSTLLGGDLADGGYAIAVDGVGSVYVTSNTTSITFPTTPGAFDTTQNGQDDVLVTKLNASGSGLVYSTFLGGSGRDLSLEIAVDSSGNAYLCGTTTDAATDFPTTPGAFDTTHNGQNDVFVTKLNAIGSGLIYSTLIGGSSNDQGYGIAVDSSGNSYLSGTTTDAATDYPTTPGAFDTTHNGEDDVFVTKLNATGSALIYSTLIGGSGRDSGDEVAIDSSGNAFVTGETSDSATDYPTTPGAFDTTENGENDAFVTKLDASGSGLVYSTFLGGSGHDQAYGATVDSEGSVFVTGFTADSITDYPTTPGAFDTTHNGGLDVFATKLNASGSALMFSTFIGGSGNDQAYGSTIDSAGSVFVTGFTADSVTEYPTTPGAFDATQNGGLDVFATKLNASGSALDYSTFIGGSENDNGYGVAVDLAGNVYLTGSTDYSATAYPTTSGAYDTTQNGGYDSFVTKFGGSSARTAFDFDGDSKTDISIYRPSLGQWWLSRSTDGVIAHTFGNSSDTIVPGDYTGDGKADVAVFRPSEGAWYVLRSENSTFFSFPFGANGDVPVPGDYDGDGRADAAVFRPSNATWYIQRSSGGTTIQTYGASTDRPVPADYDGDGKADIAIYRPSLGQWWINRSTAGLIVHTFGNNADRNVPGDYTGDGKADVAIWRPSTGEWFILRSEDFSFYSFPFGSNGDIPVPGDYDGDGKTDSGVFRPANATWYLNRTTSGILIQGFGLTTDVPTPSAFIR